MLNRKKIGGVYSATHELNRKGRRTTHLIQRAARGVSWPRTGMKKAKTRRKKGGKASRQKKKQKKTPKQKRITARKTHLVTTTPHKH